MKLITPPITLLPSSRNHQNTVIKLATSSKSRIVSAARRTRTHRVDSWAFQMEQAFRKYNDYYERLLLWSIKLDGIRYIGLFVVFFAWMVWIVGFVKVVIDFIHYSNVLIIHWDKNKQNFCCIYCILQPTNEHAVNSQNLKWWVDGLERNWILAKGTCRSMLLKYETRT